MASEPILISALSDLVTDFNRRGVVYALAEGWAYSALVEPRATTDIDLLILLEQPSREHLQTLVSSLFDSTVIHPAPMVFQGISIWRIVGIRSDQEVIVDLLLANSAYLIILKTLAGRLQDRADLEKIHARQADLPLDWAYVGQWKKTLGIGEE
jgi:predicted nucleotidyltransferase